MDRFKNFASWITILAAFCVMVLCLVWLVYPYKPIEFYNCPFPVDKREYRAGDPLRIVMDYTRYTDVQSTAIIRFTDGITFTMMPIVFQKTPGKYKGTHMTIRVPDVLPPGKYFLDICFTYPVNPIRDVVVTARTQEFEVR